MLYNDEERRAMAPAIHAGMRETNILIGPFRNILADFFAGTDFKGKRILDVGPGQCDFLDLAKERGAQTHGVDFDPAVAALGALRGHDVIVGDLKAGWPYPGQTFDGIFCRGSINLFTFQLDVGRLYAFLEGFEASLAPGSWVWAAPWNKPRDESDLGAVGSIKEHWLRSNGIALTIASPEQKKRYGIGYVVPQVEFWHRAARY